MVKFFVLCTLVLVMTTVHGEMQYNYFDDYLSSLNEEQQAVITGESRYLEGSGDDPNELRDTKFTLPIRTGLTGSKDVTCCSLGQLAGDKGYHCYPKFYAARILIRNQNRAHLRKMGFHGRDSVPHYGTKLMRTFEQCVASRGLVFNKCCHLAAEERKSKPHFDSIQRKRYMLKMKRIRMPTQVMQVNNEKTEIPKFMLEDEKIEKIPTRTQEDNTYTGF